MNLPEKLLQKDGKIWMTFELGFYDCHTESAIVLSGNRDGFLNLALTMLHRLGECYDTFHVHKLPFVQTPTGVRLTVCDDHRVTGEGKITTKDDNTFIWSISEGPLASVASAFYMISFEEFCVDHLHIDEGMDEEETSVYGSLRETMSRTISISGRSSYGDELIDAIAFSLSIQWEKEVVSRTNAQCSICLNKLISGNEGYKGVYEEHPHYLDTSCYERFIIGDGIKEIRAIMDEPFGDS